MKNTKVALLIRVSTDHQSTLRQEEELSNLCLEKNWKIVAKVMNKESGMKNSDDLVGLQEIKKLVEKGKIDKILVSEISRVGRKNSTIHSFVDFLEKHKVSLFWADMNMETLLSDFSRNPSSDIVLSVMSSLARSERDITVNRIKSGIQSKRRNRPNGEWGRRTGSVESQEEFLSKYPKAIKYLKNGLTIREISKLENLSLGTVQKIKNYL